MNWFDKLFLTSASKLAAETSRRSFIAKLGVAAAGGMMLPLLPVARFGQAHAAVPDGAPAGWNDDKTCDYWANCATDGWLCSCCGGTSTDCPPGSQPSPIAWVGTCINPGDGKAYVVQYNDCCGLSACGRCFCNRNEGDTQKYRPQKSNSVTWCYGGVDSTYHCTVQRVIALAE